MIFFCVACIRPSKARKGTIGREGANCYWCNTTSRDRAMLLNIHWAFLSKFLKDPRSVPKIVGVSDGQLMEKILKKIYQSNYKNYHYHQEPKLDITQVASNLYCSADIVSCTEVLEHVAPPIDNAFLGLYKLLTENGALVLSVPHNDKFGVHIEHFPILTDSELVLDEKPMLRGHDLRGNYLEFQDLVFHGGIGSTLEYRVFSETSLENNLIPYFKNFRKNKNLRLFGINWEPWSRVWSVSKI